MHSASQRTCTALLSVLAIVLIFSASPAQAKKAKKIPSSGPFVLDNMTWYGWWDNSPPGGDIAHPVIHSKAGGTGTFTNPITFAVAPQVQNVMKPGTKIYVPSLKDYFIMEDDCTSSGPGGPAVQGQGCDGELKAGINEFDLWLNGHDSTNSKMTACEDKLTADNVNIIIKPAAGLPVNTTPIFAKGKCNR